MVSLFLIMLIKNDNNYLELEKKKEIYLIENL